MPKVTIFLIPNQKTLISAKKSNIL